MSPPKTFTRDGISFGFALGHDFYIFNKIYFVKMSLLLEEPHEAVNFRISKVRSIDLLTCTVYIMI